VFASVSLGVAAGGDLNAATIAGNIRNSGGENRPAFFEGLNGSSTTTLEGEFYCSPIVGTEVLNPGYRGGISRVDSTNTTGKGLTAMARKGSRTCPAAFANEPSRQCASQRFVASALGQAS
jgi:hypothetical protein